MLALRLQLYREVFEQPVICLRDLHPGFQGGHCDVKVFIPNDGYIPAVLQGDMTPSNFADLVMAATTHDNWLYVGTGQNGPADSWVVLFEANLCNVPTGQRVVINIQSKLRSGVQSVSCQALLRSEEGGHAAAGQMQASCLVCIGPAAKCGAAEAVQTSPEHAAPAWQFEAAAATVAAAAVAV